MDWLEHMILWLPNVWESKTYSVEITSYLRNKLLILSQPGGSERGRGDEGDIENNHNHKVDGVNVY